MENVVKYFNTVESSFRRFRTVTLACIMASVLVFVFAMVYAFSFISNHSDNIYLLDNKGVAYSATLMGLESVEREFEVEDHVKMFHQYMFNLIPTRDAIERSVETAMNLCDDSAYQYYSDQQERQFYSRLLSNNIIQYIKIDSVKVNMGAYPYTEKTYGILYRLRESNITSYSFESQGRVVEVGRSKANPHGLMLENFIVNRTEMIGARKR